jgi:hypothetical protein
MCSFPTANALLLTPLSHTRLVLLIHTLSLSDVEKSAHIKSFDHITMKPRKDYLGVLL